MRILRFFALIAITALAACSGAMTFDRHLRQLEGKPVNDADLMLGHHAERAYQDGVDTVYVWQSHKANSVFGDSVTRNGARIGGDIIWGGIVVHNCVIRAHTQDGIIRKIRYEGDPGGCETIYGRRKDALGRDSSN